MSLQRTLPGDILVVDDNSDSRTWARVRLQQAGYVVREARNAKQAFAEIARQLPDLILLDVLLPDLDGFEITRRLRRDSALASIPIILLTVLDDRDSKIRGLEAGASDFLTKPPDHAELLARVETLLNLRRNQSELLREKTKIELLYRISRELSRELNLETLLSRILELTIPTLGASRGSLILLDKQGGILRHIFARQERGATVTDEVRGKIIQNGLAGWVIQHQAGEIIADVRADPRWMVAPGPSAPTGSAIAAPLIHQDRCTGVLTLIHEETDRFTPADLDLLYSIGSQAAVALVNAQLFWTIEQEHSRMEAILVGTADAIIATNEAQRITLLNPAAEQVFGVTLDQVEGRSLEEALPSEPLIAAFRRAEATSRPTPPTELTLPDGPTLFFTVSPVAAGPKGERGWVAVLQDITHLKELERMKNAFVSTVSHDLRSPLVTIHGYAELLSKMVDEEGKKFTQTILTTAKEMSDLVQDLLDLGKIEAGMGTDREPCRVEELVLKALKAFELQARSKEIHLATKITPVAHPVEGNPVQLRQVVDNLLSNALKYTPSGGSIIVRVWEGGGQVRVEVEDSGVGIPRKALPQIFDKFYRVPRPETRDVPGTGLGLAIVKAIVEQHGGEVWVKSELGQGSTFGFSLFPSAES